MILLDQNLWADEERRLLACLAMSLQELVEKKCTNPDQNEVVICGYLRPIIKKNSRQLRLDWIPNFETSVFKDETVSKPKGHPDIQFSRRDENYEEYHYHVECKLVRNKRIRKSQNYCQNYVKKGVIDRYRNLKYCVELPSGTMIGFVQAGEPHYLLEMVNKFLTSNNIDPVSHSQIQPFENVVELRHSLTRSDNTVFNLTHLWVDIRYQ